MLRISYENFVKRYVNVRIPMRDGIKLACDIYMPAGKGPFPAVMIRTPYQKSPAVSARYEEWGHRFADQGFAYVVCDVRGKGDSDGDFYPFAQELTDSYDAIEWIAAQPWCNQNVGTDGNSYLAYVQYFAYILNPPHLKAMAVSGCPGDLYRHGTICLNGARTLYMANWFAYTNGRGAALTADRYIGEDKFDSRDAFQIFTHLPLSDYLQNRGFYSRYWSDTLEHETYDDFFKSSSIFGSVTREHRIPVMHTAGYFDHNNKATFEYYDEMLNNCGNPEQQFVTVGPWSHEQLVDPAPQNGSFVFENGVLDIMADKFRFFGKYLRGDEVDDLPLVRAYDMGRREWNTRETLYGKNKLELYLDRGKLAERPGTVAESYVYDPDDPTLSFQFICREDPSGYAVSRNDVLSFVYEVKDEIRINGMPEVRLTVSSSCADTDFFAYLSFDLEGKQPALAFGGARLASRDPETIAPAAYGEKYTLTFKLDYLYHTLKPGDRLTLYITSSAFPMYARNLNRCEPQRDATEPAIAENTIYPESILRLAID